MRTSERDSAEDSAGNCPPRPPIERAAGCVAAGHAWHLGAALAAVVLLAQVLNHYRDDLAARRASTAR
jgi:hypothetical protein